MWKSVIKYELGIAHLKSVGAFVIKYESVGAFVIKYELGIAHPESVGAIYFFVRVWEPL